MTSEAGPMSPGPHCAECAAPMIHSRLHGYRCSRDEQHRGINWPAIRKGEYKPPSNAALAKLVRRYAEFRDVIEDGDVPDLLLIAERLEQTGTPRE